MELREASKILQTVKSALAADGYKIPPAVETDGMLMLLNKVDCEKYLTSKIKQARSSVKNAAAFKRAYTPVLFFRALETLRDGIANVTTLSLTLINKNLCGDIFPDAGKLRENEKFTNGNEHTDPKYISGSLKSLIAKMNETTPAPETDKEDFASYLTHYMRELIIMHPFEHDSPLSIRLFASAFSRIKGFSLNYNKVPPPQIKSSENDAFFTDDVTPLYIMLSGCLTYDHLAPPKKQQRTKRETTENIERRPKSIANEIMDKVKLRRAVRLQQKISRLNDQLTEIVAEKSDKKQ